jgi:ATP-binding cassette subfamily F protein 3
MLLASLSKVSKEYAGHLVLNEVDLEIKTGACVGLIGENGSGKSTVLQLLAGDVAADKGTVSRRKGLSVGYLAQQPSLAPSSTVYETAFAASPEIAGILSDLSRIDKQLALPEVFTDSLRLQRVLDEQAGLIERFQAIRGYSHESRVQTVLARLHFDSSQYGQITDTLSGGEKKLLGLARLLIREPELLLLDEPDNHLDLAAKEWLAAYINNHKGAVVLVTHDRYLLDEVSNHLVEIEDGKPSEYFCNYSAYVVEKSHRLALLEDKFNRQREEIKTLEQQARQLKYWASRNDKFAGRAEGRIKMLERAKQNLIDRPRAIRPRIRVDFRAERSGRRAIELTGINHAFAGRAVLRDFSFSVRYGERWGIIGPNGSGKSTLLKIVNGALEPHTGDVKLGANVKVGYYSQEQETLPLDLTPLKWIREISQMTEQQAINTLHKLLFTYHEMQTEIRHLSGGQKSRMQFASIMLKDANLLLLDEPTNNLDIPSSEILDTGLLAFEGTILAVSHDRYFLDKIANKLLVFSDEAEPDVFDGTFTSYAIQNGLLQYSAATGL